MLAVSVRPLNGPAPTLSMKARPPNTATAPATPPSGAYQGIWPSVSRVGSGVGMMRNSVVNTNTMGRNDTVAASHGFTSAAAQLRVHRIAERLQGARDEDEGIEQGGVHGADLQVLGRGIRRGAGRRAPAAGPAA